jgi:hypothetical protein
VLETVPRREDLNWRKVGKVQPTSARVWHTVPQAGSTSTRRSREKRRRRGYKSPDCPVSQLRQRPTVGRAISARHVVAPTVGWAHRTVFGAPTDPEDQRSAALRMEGNRAPDCYSGCPVHHSTEGKNCLPN